MEVPSEVLERLVCAKCRGSLSRGPVHLVENTKYRCGRCPLTEEDEEEGIRAVAYENLAKLMLFPCRYWENGCPSKVPFTDNESHEQACPYREYMCPIAESGQCEWTGQQAEILEHCQQEHPTKVVENACKFTYDTTQPSLNNYILFVFEVLFLIQSKVCTATRKIYHVVRFIDDPARASNFKYILDIQNNDKVFSNPGDVLPRELMVLQEDNSIVTDINCLQELLGDFKDTSFMVTINKLDYVPPPVKKFEVTVSCGKCSTETEPTYRGDWMCHKHAPKLHTCKNSTQGCTYLDVKKKCMNHELYYCQFSTRCSICSRNITGTTVDSHYIQAHGDVTRRAGTVFTVSPAAGFKRLIIDSDFGRVVCRYGLSDSNFRLWMCTTTIPSTQLYKYRCTVELSHPDTGHTFTRIPAVKYGRAEDWTVYIPRSDYNAYVHDKEVNMNINITIIDDPIQFMV